tara:strand:+ start:3585 stop:3797 length:213 start_codon:yes stop_codon:yes gene_type:complete
METVEMSEQRRFSGSGEANDDQKLAFGNRERDVIECDDAASVKLFAEPTDVDDVRSVGLDHEVLLVVFAV